MELEEKDQEPYGNLDSNLIKIDLENKNTKRDHDMDSCEIGADGFDTKRSLSDLESLSVDDCFNDEGPPIEDDIDDGGKDHPLNGVKPTSGKDGDHILAEIKDCISRRQSGPKSAGSSGANSDDSPQVKVSNQFLSIPFGIVPRASYEHGKRCSDIMGVTYNARMRQFIILDSKGITTWKRDAVDHRVNRDLQYPKYEYRLITNVVYAKKYNCYFILGKDFSLKVFNKDFLETCSVHADLRSVLFMLFNPVRDELITGGVGGTKVWRFHQQSGKALTVLKPLANYGLTLKYELPNVGGSWVKRVELDHHLEHLYCCSDTDLHVYDLAGKILFKFERAHMMSITGCRYSRNASVLVTCSIDCEVKVWSLMGGLVHTFRGHSRAVTNLIMHPHTSSIVITSSLDGTIRMWSLDTMDCIYSLVVSVDGVVWMGLTDDNMLYLSTARTVTLWNLNYIAQFWALARSRVTKMVTCGCKTKTTRLMAISEDSSVRLMARSNSKNLSTVLPPPSISPLQRVLSVCYSREFNTIYMLINPHEIWVYTTRTDPSCRIAVWDVIDVQALFLSSRSGGSAAEELKPATISVNKPAPSHRATENGAGNEMLANCCCIGILNSTAMVWTDEGYCCPIRDSYLLLGLEDGRILFMDPVIKGQKYLEFKTGKDPVLDVYHDVSHNGLITLYKLSTMMQIHIWSLPDLELQHEIYAAPDLRDYARVGYSLVTGHESGCVIFHQLEDASDPGLYKAKMVPAYEEVIEVNHKPEHLAPVISVAVCVPLKIFCSCSNDGAIKIWNEDNALMTEIALDESISSACFLNNMGDLLIGYQKHVFYIDHSKVCPQLTVPESDVDSFDKESFICEDPAVMYEGVTPNPDPVTLDNYLVPFDIEFSKDFLEGKVKLEPEPVKAEESESESDVSMAATETYMSPDSTPRRRLSLVDHMLESEVTKYDLLKQMKKTLQHLSTKEKRETAQRAHEQRLKEEKKLPAYQRKKRRMLRKTGKSDDQTIPKLEDKSEGEDTAEEDYEHFSFPRFGKSPGPTPESSTAGTPLVLSEDENVDVPVKTKEEEGLEVKVRAVIPNEDDDITKFLKASENESKTKERGSTESLTPKRKFGLNDIKVDAQTLMKEAKKEQALTAAAKRNMEQTQARRVVESDSDAGEKKPPRRERPVKKKMIDRSQRKTGRQKKSDQEKQDHTEAPPTQMQALEQREQKLSVASKASIEAEERQRREQELNEAEASAKIDQKFEDRTSDTSGIKRRPQATTDLDQAKITVPELPTVPVDQGEKETRLPSASESKSSLTSKVGGRSAIDFGSMDKMPQVKDGGDIQTDTVTEGSKTELGDSRAVTADSAVHVDGTSVVSGMSGDGGAAFRIGLMSKEVPETSGFEDGASPSQAETDGIQTPSMSDLWATPREKTPTTIETPDPSYTRPPSQMLSDTSFQPPTLSPEPLFDGFEDSEANFGSEAEYRQKEHFDQSETGGGSPDSGWMDRDLVSVSRQGDETLDQYGVAAQHVMDLRIRSAAQPLSENLLTQSEKDEAKARPQTSLEDKMLNRPELQNALTYFKQRPNTAERRFQTEDLQAAFDTSLGKYKRMARTPLASDKLYKNDDQAFSEFWHERQIERHMLIRMQKELRAQNVQKRREAMELKKQERLTQHLMNDHNHSLPDRRNIVAQPSPSPYQRASTVHGMRPVMTIPAPTPVSSRPHTAVGNYDQLSQTQPQLLHSHPQSQPHPHVALQQQIQQTLERRARQTEIELSQREKAELGQEKAFRCRLRQQPQDGEGGDHTTPDLFTTIDPWLIDPRNPRALRPKSSKSIPSKCHRYVLVTKPKTKLYYPLPTPLEEQLLATRFPGQGERVFRQYEGLLFRPPRRPMYGIEYSPYEHQLYG